MNYDPTKRMTREEAIVNPQPVCVLVNEAGKPQGVLVQALDDKFVIEPKDFKRGKGMKWDDAMFALKKAEKTTFNKQQAHIFIYLIDVINAALSSIDGDELASGHWTVTEKDSRYAWDVYFSSGTLHTNYKFYAFPVRVVEEF